MTTVASLVIGVMIVFGLGLVMLVAALFIEAIRETKQHVHRTKKR
jgi:hypothetical protein